MNKPLITSEAEYYDQLIEPPCGSMSFTHLFSPNYYGAI